MKNKMIGGLLVLALSVPALGAGVDPKDSLQNGDQAFQGGNYAAALQFYRQAAQAGSASANNDLGYLYEHGLGVQQDYAQALANYQSAAQSGNAAAQNNLGRLYAKGWGVAKDMRESFHWHSQAALQGDPEGEYWVGYDYALGRGVKRDLSKAADWMKQSAQSGYKPAQSGLATLYKDGLGVKKDETQSKEWAQKARAEKTPEAQAPQGASAVYTYTVLAGDSLWSVARRLFTRGRLWKVIYEANKDRIQDPKLIHPGETLVIQKTTTD